MKLEEVKSSVTEHVFGNCFAPCLEIITFRDHVHIGSFTEGIVKLLEVFIIWCSVPL